jgi:hypothetical protein
MTAIAGGLWDSLLGEGRYSGVLEGLRSGRIFAVAGDLVTQLEVQAKSGNRAAGWGETLSVQRGQPVTVTIRFRDPEAKNAHGDKPIVTRVDLIVGDVRGPVADSNHDQNETTKVRVRSGPQDWSRVGDVFSMSTTLGPIDRNRYLRVRGTNTSDAEPLMDRPGEDPWADLCFYSNPIFVEVVQ